MKDYDPVYISKCIREDAANPRKQALIEKLSNKRHSYIAGFPPSENVKIIIDTHKCAECGDIFAEADMHSAKVYCRDCAEHIAEEFLDECAEQESPEDIREHIEDVKGEMEFEYQRELAAYGG